MSCCYSFNDESSQYYNLYHLLSEFASKKATKTEIIIIVKTMEKPFTYKDTS